MNRIVMGLLFSLSAVAAPPLEQVSVMGFLSPNGFDTNDIVQIQVVGSFPDNCHYLGPYEVDTVGNRVTVTQFAYKYDGTARFCTQSKVTFTNTVNLGFLEKADTYTVIDKVGGRSLGHVKIVSAPEPRENPDSEPYALVDRAHIQKNPATGWPEVQMVIPLNSTCQKIRLPVSVEVQKDRGTVVVKPIVDDIPGKTCLNSPMRYVHTEKLSTAIKGGWLLHVRARGGQSINQLSYID